MVFSPTKQNPTRANKEIWIVNLRVRGDGVGFKKYQAKENATLIYLHNSDLKSLPIMTPSYLRATL